MDFKTKRCMPTGYLDSPAGVLQNPNFRKWFGDSKVVDQQGKPLVVYHGTPMSFSKFNSFPIFFTDSAGAAAGYASGQYAPAEVDSVPNVMPVYVSLKNPKVLSAEELHKLIPADDNDVNSIEWCNFDGIAESFESDGFDGVIIEGLVDYAGGSRAGRHWSAYTQYIAFRPEQVKSAIGNRGAFDPNNPDITT